MRSLLASLTNALALSLMVTGGAYAQSTKLKAEEPAKQGAAPKEAGSKKKMPELSADQKELDKLLLGAWAILANDINTEMTDELFQKAIESCTTPPKITVLDAEPGLKEELPEEKEIRGHLIYFRTDQGLQRYETKPSRVVLLPSVEKAENDDGRTIWRVFGEYAQFGIAFSDTLPGFDTVLMLEENRLFLKCENQPQTDG